MSLLIALTKSARPVREPRDWKCLCVQSRNSSTAQHKLSVCPMLSTSPTQLAVTCVSFIPKAFAALLVPSAHQSCLHLAGWDSPGDSLAPGALLPAMAKQDVAQQHSGSDVPESSWTTERKKSLRVLAAAEVRL